MHTPHTLQPSSLLRHLLGTPPAQITHPHRKPQHTCANLHHSDFLECACPACLSRSCHCSTPRPDCAHPALMGRIARRLLLLLLLRLQGLCPATTCVIAPAAAAGALCTAMQASSQTLQVGAGVVIWQGPAQHTGASKRARHAAMQEQSAASGGGRHACTHMHTLHTHSHTWTCTSTGMSHMSTVPPINKQFGLKAACSARPPCVPQCQAVCSTVRLLALLWSCVPCHETAHPTLRLHFLSISCEPNVAHRGLPLPYHQASDS